MKATITYRQDSYNTVEIEQADGSVETLKLSDVATVGARRALEAAGFDVTIR